MTDLITGGSFGTIKSISHLGIFRSNIVASETSGFNISSQKVSWFSDYLDIDYHVEIHTHIGNYCIGGRFLNSASKTFLSSGAVGIYFGEINIGGNDDYIAIYISSQKSILVFRLLCRNAFRRNY